MLAPDDARRRDRIAAIAQHARARLGTGKSPEAIAFIETFFAGVPVDDLMERSIEDLYGSAMSLWRLLAGHSPGSSIVRVFNPTVATHGWSASNTVVEIVNDDMPFLVDSVTAELNHRELAVHGVIHPVIRLKQEGGSATIDPAGAARSVMHIQIDRQGQEALASIEASLKGVLEDVRLAVQDWRKMLARVDETLNELDGRAPPVDPAEVAAARSFITWIKDDNFTFLGFREYALEGAGEHARANVVPGRGLGLLRNDDYVIFEGLRNLGALPPDVQAFVRGQRLLDVVKANRRSTVHRAVHLDVITMKTFDGAGRVVGQRVFLGLFTSAAYSQGPREIPYLKDKVERVMQRAGFARASHNAKALQHILDTFPRDELFQIGEDELFETALGILQLQERQRTALFVRKDPFERFVSMLVFTPRERYDTALRRRFEQILGRAYGGEITAWQSQFADDTHLIRIHFLIRTTPGRIPVVDTTALAAEMREAARSYVDRLRDALVDAEGEEGGLALARRYADAFPAAWRERIPAEIAVADVLRVEETLAGVSVPTLSLYRTVDAAANELGLRLYGKAAPAPLSDVLPMLENMGLRVLTETPYKISPAGADAAIYVQDFTLEVRGLASIDVPAVKPAFEETFSRVWNGLAESDGFNRLVLLAGLRAREVEVLRAYAKYLRQAAIGFSQAYMEDALAGNPAIARRLVDLFLAMQDPAQAGADAAKPAAIAAEIEHLLDGVPNADADRILRRFLNVVRVTLRTNFFQRADGRPKDYISFKLDSQKLDDLPLPRPLVEIWVCSPRVEAVHLRGGRVARGGIRWSDRREDFRTEILGLMKAQMVKNAVIVPVGSKGGFFVKRPPAPEAGREAALAEAIACYKTMMRGLLDLTDNIAVDGIKAPAAVRRHDQDDPYLVVAADKGTATFSDIANGVSREYGHWLDDAFASGGSAGYDHKGMGITARGAWEAVKRHFRELGTDIQANDFTCVGVGDMSGDVFGNGMLRSRHTRLVAAFDHRHIFLDPDPDPAAAFAERDRLFKLPRSSWDDYDKSKISAGGGVFARSAKSIRLSPEVKRLLDLAADSVTPSELMRAILKARVDLLWLGGIGTYVKSGAETNLDAGDRANDAQRIDGREIRAKVVGEGANLGCTQRGRIEYAQAGAEGKGGRINTDAIDNSAGVDTSDHEVNIKILLGDVVARGDMTMKQRDKLLAAMTDDVAAHVLVDNYLQTQALTLAQADGPAGIDSAIRLMRALEKAGRLNRAIEFLPADEELVKRQAAGRGLTRPELAVLLAYAKLWLYDLLLPSDLADDAVMQVELVGYFPPALQEGHREAILRHRLRREIVCTVVTNAVINRMGPYFVVETMERTGRGPADIARAWIAARDAFDMPAMWSAIEALDNRIGAELQTGMLRAMAHSGERIVRWILGHAGDRVDVAASVSTLKAGVSELIAAAEDWLDDDSNAAAAARRRALTGAGVPTDLAARVAALEALVAGPDIVRIADATKQNMRDVARAYFAIGDRLGFGWLREAAGRVRADTNWQRLAAEAVVDDMFQLQAEMTGRALAASKGAADLARVAAEWAERHKIALARLDALLADLKAAPSTDLAALTVVGRELRALSAG
ncbi:MAG: NAD-glutamate dehydrogenase [Alphaproteobacteria bacterium]|nr:NAD-glutamate dehydrogenase [Alphaproteobacteria bacterium]